MQPRSLAEWLTWIEHRHPAGIHLGLERIREVIARLELSRPAPVVITVGGTNGKGSTVAFLEAIYASAGYRTGAYTSPHLRRFNERVRIEGREVDDAVLCEAFEAVEQACGELALTYFEFATAAAFLIFARASIDVALLEVGLGGRLDAVNAVDADAAAVVSIGLDHTEWLGPTRDDIGWEKAHVFRSGCPAVCADSDPPPRLLACARGLGADLRLLGRDFRIEPAAGEGWCWSGRGTRYEDLPPPALPGAFQLQNAAAAIALVDALQGKVPVAAEAIRSGLLGVSLAGRVQVLEGPVTWIFDVAHNVSAARALAEVLGGTAPPAGSRAVPGAARPGGEGGAARTLAVFGIMNDKDVAGVVGELAPLVDVWFVASLPPPRGLASADVAAVVERAGSGHPAEFPAVAEACAAARAAARPGDRIVVFGSFLVVGPGLAAAGPGGPSA